MVGTTRRSSLNEALAARLEERETRAVRRHLRPIASGIGPRVTIDGRSVLQFCSNDYLGLAAHPAVTGAAAEALAAYGTGAGAARLVVGTSSSHVTLEHAIAQLKRTEAAVVLASGYHANTGVLPALTGPEDIIFSDALNHASIIDGCRLSRARVEIYRHADAAHLESLLAASTDARRRVIVTETVFAMDGDLAPLRDLVALAARHDASLVVDEAHATGVFGPRGGGLVDALGLEDAVEVQIGTLSKAIGALGGYVAGSRALIDTVVNDARTFIYTTALPPAIAAAAHAAIGLIAREPERRARLLSHAAMLRAQLSAAGFRVSAGESPILPVIIGDAAAAIAMSDALLDRGVLVPAIRPPTVPAGTARLRVTPMATHTDADLAEAVDVFIAAGRATGQL